MNANVSRFHWMRTLGNFSYVLAVAFLIASLAVNALPAQRAMAANATLDCPLPQYNPTHYALEPGQSVTCTIHNAVLSGSPSTVDVYIQSTDLGNVTVTGHVSGTNITFSYTGHARGCNTSVVRYDNGDGRKQNIDGLKGFGFVDGSGSPIACGGGATSTPTDVPQDPTATPTDKPQEPTATPTDTLEDPKANPTDDPADPTATPTDSPSDPTATLTGSPSDPTATPTSTLEDPESTQTTTPSPDSLTVSSFCGPNPKHVNWWKITNSSAGKAAVSWQIQPGGAPADDADVPANGEYEFSTVRVTDSDSLDVYFDPQGQQFVGSAEAAQGCTHPAGTPNPGATFVPGGPSGQAEVLIPVTGAALNTGGSLRLVFFNVGIGFLGLGLVLNGLARERKNLDI